MTAHSSAKHLAHIAQIAATQHGVIARHQLVELGWSTSGIRSLDARGYLYPLHPGIWAVGHPGISFQGRVMAAVLGAGTSAVASARCAAQLMHIDPLGSQTVEIVSPDRHRPLEGAIIHFTRFCHAPMSPPSTGSR